MGTSKNLRKQIVGLEVQKTVHENKIQEELEKSAPNYLRIKKWLKDVRVFEAEVDKLYRKLPEGRRGGKEWKR